MQSAARSSGRVLLRKLSPPHQGSNSIPPIGRIGSGESPLLVDPSTTVIPAASFTTAVSQRANKTALKNRPLSPFLSQKRPEKSSTLSIGERITLICLGLVLLPAPEIAKFSQFMY